MKTAITLLLAMGMGLIACDPKSKVAKENSATAVEHSTKPSLEKPVSPKPIYVTSTEFKTGLGKVYEGYVKIEKALAQDDFGQAKEAFNGMHALLHMIPTESLDTSAKAHWDSLDGNFMEVLHPMAAAANLAGMRDHFMDFSPLVLRAIEEFGALSSMSVYVFHCPMAKHNQGADWLQADSVLLNPYLGKSMPDCGSPIKKISLGG